MCLATVDCGFVIKTAVYIAYEIQPTEYLVILVQLTIPGKVTCFSVVDIPTELEWYWRLDKIIKVLTHVGVGAD